MIPDVDTAMRTPAPTPATLVRLVDRDRVHALGVDPSAVAITDGTTSLDWSAYTDRVARLAGTLRQLEVGLGDRVGVRLAKSVDSFVAVHAILRAGAVVVPVDPLAPPEHAASALTDAGASALVAEARVRGLADVVRATPVRAVALVGGEPDSLAGLGVEVRTGDEISRADPAPPADVEPDAPAYLIYTSGSTGAPKGIVHTHASALAYAATAAEVYGLHARDRLANIAPLHFDQSTFELYSAPLVGASVVTVPDPVLRFPASVAKLIDEQGVTVWYSVPYVLDQLVSRGALAERDLSSLRWVLYGGEAYPPARLAELMRRLPGATVSNVYGPAEVNQCTFHHLSEPPTDDRPIPIGQAWPAAELAVVDPDDASVDVSPGAPGLLLVSGPTTMAGYWGRPDLTGAAMLERPSPEGASRRWYVTGDLVVADEHGVLTFVGRADHQVKVRGHRVELEAVDAALSELPGVDEGTVVVRRPGDGDDHLVGLVVGDGDLDPAALRGALAARLPRYAVPTEVRAVPRLPRTSTGKVDRRAAASLLDPP